ncbi:hypothetical protein OAH29_00775 [Akkermansiaceae bacterium]|nr:hypothetical protein [Akkermansiaceae bacterium]
MERLGFIRKHLKEFGCANEVSDKRKNLSFLARVVRALGDSKPKWWKRFLSAVLATLILVGCGKIAEEPNAAFIDLVRSIWWEEATATLLESHGQTAIRYSYEVGEETFSGTRFSFGNVSGGLMGVEILEFIENQNSDEGFTIFVNPDAAGEAVIQRSLTPNTWILIPLSLVLLALGIAIAGYAVLPTIIYWWRGKLRSQFILNAPELIVSSLKDGGAGTKLLFFSMTIVHRGGVLLDVVNLLDPLNLTGGGGRWATDDQIRRFAMAICLGCLGIFCRGRFVYWLGDLPEIIWLSTPRCGVFLGWLEE